MRVCTTEVVAECPVPTKSKLSQTLKDPPRLQSAINIALRGMAIPGESLVEATLRYEFSIQGHLPYLAKWSQPFAVSIFRDPSCLINAISPALSVMVPTSLTGPS